MFLRYRWAQGRFQGVKIKPNGATWSRNYTKREPPNCQNGNKNNQNGAKGIKSAPKRKQQQKPKTMFRKGWHWDVNSNSVYSAGSPFFLNLRSTMASFRTQIDVKTLQTSMPKQVSNKKHENRLIFLCVNFVDSLMLLEGLASCVLERKR